MAYGLSLNDSDWQTIHIRSIDEGVDYAEVILGTRASNPIVWHPDGGFYYSRYPVPGMTSLKEKARSNCVCFHVLGTPQEEDLLIFESEEDTLRYQTVASSDGQYLLLKEMQGTAANTRWYCRKITSSEPFVLLVSEADADYQFIGNDSTCFYFTTTLNAPKGRIIALSLEGEQWEEVLPEQADVIQCVSFIHGVFVIVFARDVHHTLTFYTHNGVFLREIPLPCGSIRGVAGKAQDGEFFFRFSSFLSAGTIYRYDFATDALEVFRQIESGFDASSYSVSQKFYSSKDETRIPLFLVHKRDLVLDGTTPTLLTGYGGFRISQWPTFSSAARFWIEHGGIYALANIRGGGEYGEEWHQAGMLENKQNCFDDFIGAAEWLCAQKYTSPSCLAIHGWSNGGLLVAACLVQRPELFGAVVCCTPLTDMLRYPQLGVGYYWLKEYGDAEGNAEHFQFLSRYSPLHTIQQRRIYPPTLILAGAADDRVSPIHAMKFAAALQDATDGMHPIFLSVPEKTGHLNGNTMWSTIFSFLFQLFSLDPW